jgi:hypothetical protein
MKTDLKIFIKSLIVSIVLTVCILAFFNKLKYESSLESIKIVETKECALMESIHQGARGRQWSSVLLKIKPENKVFTVSADILLGIKIPLEDLRQGVECEIERDPKGLFLRVKKLKDQEVNYQWLSIE